MFIVFGIVLVLIGLIGVLGFQIDVLLAFIPIWLAKRTASYQCYVEFKFRAIITWLVGLAGGGVMFYDAFSTKVYYGLWPVIIPCIFFLIVYLLENLFDSV